MFMIAAAALATLQPQQAAPVTAQATATIRILAGVRLRLDAPVNAGAPAARNTVLRMHDGSVKTAKLIEFQ